MGPSHDAVAILPGALRVHLVDPPAYTPPYDHALAGALARAGAEVQLWTSRFAYGDVPAAQGYTIREAFYRSAVGGAGSRLRRAVKLAEHVPDMLRYRRAARGADVVHLQWLAVPQLDGPLLPRDRPLVLTAHDVLPREPRPGQLRAHLRLLERMDAIVVHSEDGAKRLRTERVRPEKVHVIPHGAFPTAPVTRPLPPELAAVEVPVVLFFGLLRPYKGLDVLLEAWRGITDAELWIVGRPRIPLEPLRAAAPPGVRFVPRFVPEDELPAFFARADLVVLPYIEIDQSGVLFTALGHGRPLLLSAVGGFPELAATGAARLVPPGEAPALHSALRELIADPAERERLAAAARAAATGPYSWDAVAERTLALYRRLT